MAGKRFKIVKRIILVILSLALLTSWCNISAADAKAEDVAKLISSATAYVEEILQPVKIEITEREQQAEAERLAKLGYPEGYDPSNPVANGEFTEEDWATIQQEEAMNSLGEEAMRDYYMDMYEPLPDPLFD